MNKTNKTNSRKRSSNNRNNRNNRNNGGDWRRQFGFKGKFRFNLREMVLWFLVGLIGLSFLTSLFNPQVLFEEVPLSQVLADVKNGRIEKIDVAGDRLSVVYKDGREVVTHKEASESLVKTLETAGINPQDVEINIKDSVGLFAFFALLGNIFPVILTGLILFAMFRGARGASDTLFTFGMSRAKQFTKGMQKVTFADVAGIDEAKQEVQEIVDFLKHSKKYQKVGARTPKGVLLLGASGTGKTLLARAMAGEANVPFFSMAGSEFMEMLVGVGASRVRDLFKTAKAKAPSIIFIDEIDAIGRARTVGIVGGHDEREQTLNQILVEMDGFEPNTAVLVIAASNRGDLLDPALLRPGRFDRRIVLDMPDIQGREAILKIHSRGKPFTDTVNWHKVAKRTVGFSGADLENMLNEAAILAARENKTVIDMDDLEEAATKVKLGPEKKRLQTDLDRKMTAYHEAGHALVTHFLPNMDLVHRISIVSRGMALGFTLIPPERDRLHETKTHLLEQITSMMGGRAAEELVFAEMTSGAANDISQASNLAREMVITYGMSELGPINFGVNVDVTEWGHKFFERPQISPKMQNLIDAQVKKMIDKAYQQAVAILKRERKRLDLVAQELVRSETLEGDEFEKLMGGPAKGKKAFAATRA